MLRLSRLVTGACRSLQGGTDAGLSTGQCAALADRGVSTAAAASQSVGGAWQLARAPPLCRLMQRPPKLVRPQWNGLGSGISGNASRMADFLYEKEEFQEKEKELSEEEKSAKAAR